MIRTRLLCLSVSVATALVGCTAVGPDYQIPEDSAFAKAQQAAAKFDGNGSDAVATQLPAIEGDWWKLYDDPSLNALVQQALQVNAELRVAAAHLEQAQARYAQARAAGGLDTEVEASVARGAISAQSMLQPEPLPPATFSEGALSLSYQFDLFGRIRRGAEAAHANTEAAQAAADLARISVAASVVAAYAEICHSNHELSVAKHSIDLQRQSRDVAARLLAAGRGTSTAVQRADSQLALLQASLPPLETQRLAAGYKLAELLDLPPDQTPKQVLQCQSAPTLHQAIPVGDGASLLRRRPDVRKAERAVAAATAEIGVATAELYPDIRLGASFGASGLLEDFGKPVTQMWSLGPLISWTLPGNGAHARVAAAKAESKAALAEFDKVVLNALRETQTILVRYGQDLQREASLREARDHAQAAADNERSMYQAGRHPYLASLDASRSLADADAALAAAEAQVSQDQIHLFLALGGGWRKDAQSTSNAN